jgi:hypothetical protein
MHTYTHMHIHWKDGEWILPMAAFNRDIAVRYCKYIARLSRYRITKWEYSSHPYSPNGQTYSHNPN